MSLVVVDNGASAIKAGLVQAPAPRIVMDAVVHSKSDKSTLGMKWTDAKITHFCFRIPLEKFSDWQAQMKIDSLLVPFCFVGALLSAFKALLSAA
ncbi:hypothetical protein C8R43DRAFT_1119320 [Mycena crocata]|nr:hypothetical protein C8R43DRAFT_1119320 [Mycena crocata]